MKILIFLFALISSQAFADSRPVVIAVIDTGFNLSVTDDHSFLCKFGHRDFTKLGEYKPSSYTSDPVPVDNHGHGTNIAGLVRRYASESNKPFCLVILKYYDPKKTADPLTAEVNAIKFATNIKADIINFSGGGINYSKKEKEAVKAYLDHGGIFVAAAGNEGKDLAQQAYYPAMADGRVIIVGNLSKTTLEPVKSSNYGKSVTRWEYGENQVGFTLMMTGTSQAAAIAAGKIVGEKEFPYDRSKKIVALRK